MKNKQKLNTDTPIPYVKVRHLVYTQALNVIFYLLSLLGHLEIEQVQ